MDSSYRPVYTKNVEWSNTGTSDVMTFYPTLEEITNFSDLIRRIESQGAHISSGIAKIVPPKGWSPRPSKPSDYSDLDSNVIEQPVRERIHGSIGSYVKDNIVYRKTMTVRDFRKAAFSKKMRNPRADLDLVELERYYWKNITRHEPIYGADTPGYLCDCENLNPNNLKTILDLTKNNCPPIKGVTTVFLYFGMWKASFPWHSEDMDLYSINLLHYGDPKFWYAIPPAASEKFERLAAQRFPDDAKNCRAFLRHKTFILSPSLLKTYSIPYGTMVQYPGEIIVTFPKGYHMGFNTGYNCAESTNFALDRWVDYGKNAVLCHCRDDGVQIDMRAYMQLYRPDECKDWEEYWYNTSPALRGTNVNISAKNAVKSIPTTTTSTALTTARQKKIEKIKSSMKNLWSRSQVDLFAEKQYNEKCGLLYPHCAICQYFWPRDTWFVQGVPVSEVPPKSRRFVHEQVFHKDDEVHRSNFDIEEDDLLSCDNCKVVVHRHCYSARKKCEIPVKLEPVSNEEPSGFRSNNTLPIETTDPSISLRIADDSAGTSQQSTSAGLQETCALADKWLCDRCDRSSDILIRSAYCIACELRCGALIELDDQGSFIHVICVLMNTNIKFAKPELHTEPYYVNHTENKFSPKKVHRDCSNFEQTLFISPEKPILSVPASVVPTSFVTPSQTSPTSASFLGSPPVAPGCSRLSSTSSLPTVYECEVCGHQGDDLIRCDICVETEELGASLRFHVTCAPIADVSFERRFFPARTCVVCAFHNTSRALIDMRRIDLKQIVYVYSSEENMVGRGRVRYIYENVWATIEFLDGSISKEVFSCEITSCECKHFGCNGYHIPGSLVYIKWHDGLVYQAYYRNKVPVKRYRVEIEPSKTCPRRFVEASPDNIYRSDEPLPEEIRKALLKRYSDWEVGVDDDC